MNREKLFNIITLSFYDKLLEKEFIKEYSARSVKIVRIGLSLGSFTFIVVGFLLDKNFFPDNPQILYGWRIAGALVMISTAIFIGTNFARKHFQMFMICTLTLVSIAIMKTAITYHEGGLYNSSIAVTAFIIFIHTLSRIKFIYAALFTGSFILTYGFLLSNIYMPAEVVTQTIAFFIVTNFFGMSASYGIEFNIRDAFVKSKQLETSQQLLEAEYKRTSDELVSVKELQLSMLPEKSHMPCNIDIGFHMSTATEVGGDYCDYIIEKDDSLTFAIGDATGHGARASTMVMAIKILFSEYASKTTIKEFLRHASTTIKNLKLPKLYMTLALGKISNNKLIISGAGIPSALHYRNSQNNIERISLKGIPLGTFANPGYEEKEILFEKNDILVLMTDGVTELFNSKGEMYGTELIEEQLKSMAELSSQNIIDQIVVEANKWRGTEPLHDDMTLLALKVKS